MSATAERLARPATETSARPRPAIEGAAAHRVLARLLGDPAARGLSFRFQVQGTSMAPFIRDGDVLTLTTGAGARPRPGDVLAYLRPQSGRVIIHRVARTGRRGHTLKGDNCPAPDGLVPDAHVLGRVTGIERNGRRVRLGLGPERALIAWLGRGTPVRRRLAVLAPVVRALRRIRQATRGKARMGT